MFKCFYGSQSAQLKILEISCLVLKKKKLKKNINYKNVIVFLFYFLFLEFYERKNENKKVLIFIVSFTKS